MKLIYRRFRCNKQRGVAVVTDEALLPRNDQSKALQERRHCKIMSLQYSPKTSQTSAELIKQEAHCIQRRKRTETSSVIMTSYLIIMISLVGMVFLAHNTLKI